MSHVDNTNFVPITMDILPCNLFLLLLDIVMGISIEISINIDIVQTVFCILYHTLTISPFFWARTLDFNISCHSAAILRMDQ